MASSSKNYGAYRAFETLVAPARAQSELWRLLAAIPLIIAGFLTLNLAYFGVLKQIVAPDLWSILGNELTDGSTPRAVVLMLFNFLALTISMAVVVFALHNRSLLALIGPIRPAFRDFARVFAFLALLNLVFWMLPWPGQLAPQANLDLATWLSWLPLALPAIALQAGTEELAFRGYIQTQLAARFRSPLIWMILPSVIFAVLHFDPQTFGSNAWVVAAWAGVFALLVADITARSGSLGPAFALHFANNISAILITAMVGNWDGLALQALPVSADDPEAFRAIMMLEGGVMLCSWLAARLAIRR